MTDKDLTVRRYRKKPVVIEAYQTKIEVAISTLEGTMIANPGDWIITGVKDEKYPCKPDIFEATYDLVEECKILKTDKSCPFNDENGCGEYCEWFIADGKGSGGCVIHRIANSFVDLPYTISNLLHP